MGASGREHHSRFWQNAAEITHEFLEHINKTTDMAQTLDFKFGDYLCKCISDIKLAVIMNSTARSNVSDYETQVY